MKELSHPLSKYGLKQNSKVMMLGDNENLPRQPSTDKVGEAMRKLEEIRRFTRTDLLPSVDLYLAAAFPESAEEKKRLKDMQMRVSEALLQQMLKIDAMATVDDGNVRTLRKEVVRWLNELLEKVDLKKAGLNAPLN